MPKPLDPKITDILKAHGETKEAVWDCHGTWVVKHQALERIAAKAGVIYSAPQVLVAQPDAAAILVTGTLGENSEWSIGEAAPKNNKNAYPFAMAEKRAKDRVILKLIGLHGLAYSEEEADDFKESASNPASATKAQKEPFSSFYKTTLEAMLLSETKADLNDWKNKNVKAIDALSEQEKVELRKEYVAMLANLPISVAEAAE